MLMFMGDSPQFEVLYTSLRNRVKLIIEEHNIVATIISGDLGSKGSIPRNYDFMKFFKLFYKRNIPVLTCPGNHDLFQELIANGVAFSQYVSKIRALENDWEELINEKYHNCNRDVFQNHLKKFSENQGTFLHLNDINLIILSINSCKSIYVNQLGTTDKGEIILDQTKLNRGFPNLDELTKIIEEVRTVVNPECFHKAHKFIITHHPTLHHLNKQPDILELLDKNNITLNFSGHIHDYDFLTDSDFYILNYIAGSPLVNPAERTIQGKTADLQFTRYEFDTTLKAITPIIYKYERPGWNPKYKHNHRAHYENQQRRAMEQVFTVINSEYQRDSRISSNLYKRLELTETDLKNWANEAYNECIDKKIFHPLEWLKFIKEKLMQDKIIEKLENEEDKDLLEALANEALILDKDVKIGFIR